MKARQRYAADPKSGQDTTRRWREKNRFWRSGWSNVDYETALKAQDGHCAICAVVPPRLMPDHCHRTGTRRGLLCFQCNIALGLLKDNPTTAKRAADYLEQFAR